MDIDNREVAWINVPSNTTQTIVPDVNDLVNFTLPNVPIDFEGIQQT